MKKNSSLTPRTIVAALVLICGTLLFALGFKTELSTRFHGAKMPDQKSKVAVLAGPELWAQLQKQAGGTLEQASGPNAPTAGNEVNLTPAPPDPGLKVGFENFEAPGMLVDVSSTSQGPGAATVEYIGHDAGEPSVGVNWNSTQDPVKGITVFQSDLQTNFIKFNDICDANPKAVWYNSQAPTSQFVNSDPIGFVDRDTGRAFAGQLTLTSPECKISFTDTDGKDAMGNPGPSGWTPSTGPLGSGIDHQTIGAGPYHAPIPARPPGTVYPNAVYYCSQDGLSVGGNAPPAFCLRSDDGGLNFNFGPIPISTTACGGLHGHVKVAPDGTVYVPFNSCNGKGAVDVSTDNGATWTFRNVQTATESTVASSRFQDPAVAIDKAGKVYFVMASGDSTAAVATSTDQGLTWQNLYDVGAAFGLKNIAFPAAVAGDSGRAAVSFFGTTEAGDTQASTFNGVWHLYVATTFDGGAHWTTVDATPNAPVQRGVIWQQGMVNIGRNLLDFFDMTVDKEGRIQVGYVSGCVGGPCAQSPTTATFHGNAYTATGVIARQSGGRRLFAANDPAAVATVPGMPWLNQRRVGNVVHLGWSEADDGNSPILSYQILRGTTSGGETPLATVPANSSIYDDTTATDPTKTYYYKVVAVNAVGSSCANNEIAAPYVGDTCNGLVMQTNPPGHPEQSSHGAAPASLAIDWLSVAEPHPSAVSPAADTFKFVLKVTNMGATPPPNSRWRVVWNTYLATGQQFFVGMRTNAQSVPTFEFGEVATGAIPPVIGLVGVPQEVKKGNALPESNFNADGTITVYVKKSDVGNPPIGYLLGAVNGRTFTGDTPESGNLERSTALIDHTFTKAQRDNGFPAATYVVEGNSVTPCGLASPTPTATATATPTATATATPVATATATATASPTATTAPSATPTATATVTPVATPTATATATASPSATATATASPIATATATATASATATSTPSATATATASPIATATATASPTATATATATASATATATPTATPTATATATPAQLQNISTRARIQTGDNISIGGFIISGNVPKKVIVRGLGPSITSGGQPVPGTLANPTLELHDQNGVIASNDDWKESQQTEIQNSGFAPTDERESAIVRTLNPGPYTAVLRGKNNTTGIGLIEIYDLDLAADSHLANISTRGFVDTGDNVMIGGFVTGPSNRGDSHIVVRGRGPSLEDSGITNALQDPVIELHDKNGNTLATNDDWLLDSNANFVLFSGTAPSDTRESALYRILPPDSYTVILRGKNNTTGVGIVEIFDLQ